MYTTKPAEKSSNMQKCRSDRNRRRHHRPTQTTTVTTYHPVVSGDFPLALLTVLMAFWFHCQLHFPLLALSHPLSTAICKQCCFHLISRNLELQTTNARTFMQLPLSSKARTPPLTITDRNGNAEPRDRVTVRGARWFICADFCQSIAFKRWREDGNLRIATISTTYKQNIHPLTRTRLRLCTVSTTTAANVSYSDWVVFGLHKKFRLEAVQLTLAA